jgi:hypothetical protein
MCTVVHAHTLRVASFSSSCSCAMACRPASTCVPCVRVCAQQVSACVLHSMCSRLGEVCTRPHSLMLLCWRWAQQSVRGACRHLRRDVLDGQLGNGQRLKPARGAAAWIAAACQAHAGCGTAHGLMSDACVRPCHSLCCGVLWCAVLCCMCARVRTQAAQLAGLAEGLSGTAAASPATANGSSSSSSSSGGGSGGRAHQLEAIIHQHVPIFHTEHCVFCKVCVCVYVCVGARRAWRCARGAWCRVTPSLHHFATPVTRSQVSE